MGVYKVRVATGNFLLAGTFSAISITLVGTHEESDKKPLDNCGKDFNPGASIPELVKYLTMWIYCCLARHDTLNNGQYHLGAWMPNNPPSMRNPPPTAKGTASLESYLDTIPEVNTTSLILFTLWVICCEPGDSRPLGTYPDEHFTEEEPKQLIKAFQGRLAQISQEIQERNKALPIAYRYLEPHQIENSTSI